MRYEIAATEVAKMVFDKLSGIIAQQFGVSKDEITEETSFVEDLGADSLDLVELIMSVEEAFELGEVEDETLDGVKTVGDVVNFIKDRIGE
jgi:acyl carrier protein